MNNNWEGNFEFVIGRAKDGSNVVARQNTNHFQGIDSILLREAIGQVEFESLPEKGLSIYTHTFNQQVGWCEVVPTQRQHLPNVFYAPRTDASGEARFDNRTRKERWTRWVIGVEKLKAYEITFGLMRSRNGNPADLVLIFASYGKQIALEPGDPRATDQDRLWWFNPETKKGHAFVAPYDNRKVTSKVPLDFCPS